jgi:hypothetical protein
MWIAGEPILRHPRRQPRLLETLNVPLDLPHGIANGLVDAEILASFHHLLCCTLEHGFHATLLLNES